MTDEPSKESASAGWEEMAEAVDADAEPDFEDMSNKELLEHVADLDPETYPIARRAEAALTQLEGSSA